ncbi:MAG: hypothetical protein IJR33_10445 [Clostridia bacterium]|nr:hypothetical protein [Clostridia bacterium]
MIDLYIDDARLERIDLRHNTPTLVFKNREKYETTRIGVDNEELYNILMMVSRMCEVADIIHPATIKRKNGE